MKKIIIIAVLLLHAATGYCFIGTIYEELKGLVKTGIDKIESLTLVQELTEITILLEQVACMEYEYEKNVKLLELQYGSECFFNSDVFIMDYKLGYIERAVYALIETLMSDSETTQTNKAVSIGELSALVQQVLKDLIALNKKMESQIISESISIDLRTQQYKNLSKAVSFNPLSK